MNRVILGKNHCGVEMNYDRLVIEKISFVNMREIWSRGQLFYTQQTASLVYSTAIRYALIKKR